MNAIDKPFPRTHEPSASGWRQRRSSAAREFHTGVVRAPLPRWQDRHSVLSRFLITLAAVGCLSARGFSQSTPQISELTPPRLWQRLEFSIGNVPSAGNPFDPDLIRLDATFTSPSGRKTTVPAFWHQDYQRSLSGGYESDVPQGTAGWRLRFTPPETGGYSVSLGIHTNGQAWGGPVSTNFTVPASLPPTRFGYVGIAPGAQYFQTGDGQSAAVDRAGCLLGRWAGHL